MLVLPLITNTFLFRIHTICKQKPENNKKITSKSLRLFFSLAFSTSLSVLRLPIPHKKLKTQIAHSFPLNIVNSQQFSDRHKYGEGIALVRVFRSLIFEKLACSVL